MRINLPPATKPCQPQPGWVYLDSGYPHANHGRYSVLATQPIKTLVTQDDITTITDIIAGTTQTSQHDPLELLATHTPDWQPQPKLPFSGGWLGYIGYELAWRTTATRHEPATLADPDVNLPDMWFGLYAWALIYDHHTQEAWLSYPSNQPQPDLSEDLLALHLPHRGAESTYQHKAQSIDSNFSQATYQDAFSQIKAQITLGNCYQVNLAQRFQCATSGSPWQAYLQFRKQNPAPYGAYLQISANQAVQSLSPELFLSVEGGKVTTKPIKGTVKRDPDPKSDNQLKQHLATSSKDQAENIMIVDLMRHDLSQHCQAGTVTVSKLFDVETLPSVHHLVTTVQGQLAENHSTWDLIRGCLPGGSITGAPKLSAMQIINALEPNRRNVYCGNIGWIQANGDCCLNIAIRTLMWDDDQLYCHAGGGIVADSTVDAEYQETFSKVAKIMACLG